MATEPPFASSRARGPRWSRLASGPFKPFRPFDLEPGQSAFLLLKGVFANCQVMISHGGIRLTDFPVRYRFLWKTATAHIPLEGGLTINPKNNPRIRCP